MELSAHFERFLRFYTLGPIFRSALGIVSGGFLCALIYR
ncbi:conserved hypothetical protein [delta proteobacterium NaphS2]|nr:conserved hypothetical protein [delta proteobacterium NaphS2]